MTNLQSQFGKIAIGGGEDKFFRDPQTIAKIQKRDEINMQVGITKHTIGTFSPWDRIYGSLFWRGKKLPILGKGGPKLVFRI